MSAPLHGLLLTGGRSRRMQRDKAVIEYGGESQLRRALALLEPLVARVHVSVRPDQRDDPGRAGLAQVVDRIADAGPIAGIEAALAAHPQAAWLVLACDLPFLDAATLQQLIAARAPHRLATAFRSSHDGKPEPLCAIYEPASAAPIKAWLDAGQRCPRNFLASHDVELLELRNPAALDNINTADEYRAASARLAAPATGDASAGAASPSAAAAAAPRRISVRYFALLREQAGRSEESLLTAAPDARALYAELALLRGLRLAPAQLRVAVNDDFAEWTRPLAEGDAVAFLPPVAGG